MKAYVSAKIISQERNGGIFTMRLLAPEVAQYAKPGQFVMVYMDKGEHLLPRPISLYDVDKAEGVISLVYIIAGAGTKIMTEWPAGHAVRLLGPIGNGFNMNISPGKRVALVGGGFGAAPLYYLARELGKKGVQMDVFLGFRKDTPSLTRVFAELTENLYVATEEAVEDKKAAIEDKEAAQNFQLVANSNQLKINSPILRQGFVTDLLPQSPAFSAILSCGPAPMLKSLAAYAHSHNIPCQVSVEERMACGLGACKGCVVKTLVGYRLCCTAGPVFDSKEVIFS